MSICESCDNTKMDENNTCLVLLSPTQQAYQDQKRCPFATVDGRVGEFIDGIFYTYDQIAQPNIEELMKIFYTQSENEEF